MPDSAVRKASLFSTPDTNDHGLSIAAGVKLKHYQQIGPTLSLQASHLSTVAIWAGTPDEKTAVWILGAVGAHKFTQRQHIPARKSVFVGPFLHIIPA